jgi:protein-S-isoprenylcysteine O-methyltransferase Ste14
VRTPLAVPPAKPARAPDARRLPAGAFLLKRRTSHTRWLVLTLLPLPAVAQPLWMSHWLGEALETAGALCVAVCIVGRVWCAIYIGGRKSSRLVTRGPYSVVRNPLYLFSFIGLVGIALVSKMATLLIVAVLIFAAYYRTVVAREEAYLLRLHGATFEAYLRTVPRWWPNFARWRDSRRRVFSTKVVLTHIRDSSLFLMGAVFFESRDLLREFELVPVLLRLP